MQSRSITAPKGFRAAGGTCGIKASGKPDLMLLVADELCSAAGVFTTNRIKGAPVLIGERHVKKGKARAIICNSGNSNVATGSKGLNDAIAMCKAVADAIGCDPGHVLPASTGIIGRPLPIDKIKQGITQLAPQLAAGERADADAAKAILTTDLVDKTALRTLTICRQRITLGGIAKGSGMIAPSLATMLGFVTTDAAVSPSVLRSLLKQATTASFNRVSVDTDTSTSDTVYMLASAAAGNPTIKSASSPEAKKLLAALTELCGELAYAIVKDGEGATHVFRVTVKNARNEEDADRVGRAITDSPLIKCAVHGGDPNWGRLAMAVGKSGASFDPAKLKLYIGKTAVFRNQMPIAFTPAIEQSLQSEMTRPEVSFTVDLGVGKTGCIWLGCDLSREYVGINADYST
jgi:glutamate N-acetyltransferase/amino-acid N-acetyltransferase